METPEKHLEERVLSRMLFFSDAVFAIVLTLLALDLRLPDAPMPGALIELIPNLAAFIASFALISIFWAAHVSITRRLIAFDWPTLWCNLLFLLVITLMPVATVILGRGGTSGWTWVSYSAVIASASVTQTILFLCASRPGAGLMTPMPTQEYWARLIRAISPGLAFGAGIALSFSSYAQWAPWCWTVMLPLRVVTNFAFKPPSAPRSPAGSA